MLDGEIGQELLGQISAHEVVGLGFVEGGFRNMINNTRPVTAPEDVGGVKYRIMQNPVFIERFGSLSGNAVLMSERAQLPDRGPARRAAPGSRQRHRRPTRRSGGE